jgi:hypothetical protein
MHIRRNANPESLKMGTTILAINMMAAMGNIPLLINDMTPDMMVSGDPAPKRTTCVIGQMFAGISRKKPVSTKAQVWETLDGIRNSTCEPHLGHRR